MPLANIANRNVVIQCVIALNCLILSACVSAPSKPPEAAVSTNQDTVKNQDTAPNQDQAVIASPSIPKADDNKQTAANNVSEQAQTTRAMPDDTAGEKVATNATPASSQPDSIAKTEDKTHLVAKKDESIEKPKQDTAKITKPNVITPQVEIPKKRQPALTSKPVKAILGSKFGIWTLDKNKQGNCILTTPTFQVREKDFSSQFWLDIEVNKLTLNSSLTLNASMPNTGFQFNDESLIPFDKQELPSRITIERSIIEPMANSETLTVHLNGKEVGDSILKKEISLKDAEDAVLALKACK